MGAGFAAEAAFGAVALGEGVEAAAALGDVPLAALVDAAVVDAAVVDGAAPPEDGRDAALEAETRLVAVVGVEWPVLDTGTLWADALVLGALDVDGAFATDSAVSESAATVDGPAGGATVPGAARASPAAPVIGMRVPQ